MIDWENSNHNVQWWWEQLKLTDDWNTLPTEARKDLTTKLQRAALALGSLNISKEEILGLISLYDAPTVFDAILTLATLGDKERMNDFQLRAYLKKTVKNIWMNQHPTSQTTWQHKEPEPEYTPASKETMDKCSPYRLLKKRCSVCGTILRKDNGSSKCSKCQQNGRKVEHKSEEIRIADN